MIREYKTIREISGPLMVVDHVQGVTYDELAEIVLSDGSTRRCKVLEVNGDRAVVQLFESSAGINLADSRIRFLGHPLQLAVSRDMLGRVFNGMGQHIDGGQEGAGGRDVGGGQVLEVAAHGKFALPLGQIEMFGAHFRRNVRKKVIKVAHTHDGEHFLHFVRRMGNEWHRGAPCSEGCRAGGKKAAGPGPCRSTD